MRQGVVDLIDQVYTTNNLFRSFQYVCNSLCRSIKTLICAANASQREGKGIRHFTERHQTTTSPTASAQLAPHIWQPSTGTHIWVIEHTNTALYSDAQVAEFPAIDIWIYMYPSLSVPLFQYLKSLCLRCSNKLKTAYHTLLEQHCLSDKLYSIANL